MEIVRSIGKDQQIIINNILKLHNNNQPIDLDVTYSKGVFYKNGKVEQPKFKTDLQPQTEDTLQASSDNLPFEDNSLKCIMFDPPFMIGGKTYKENKEGSSIILKRFSIYHSFDELKEHYYKTLKELYRILDKDGIVIMKLQNTISSGKQYMSHFYTCKSAIDVGFYIQDEFILESKSKMTSFGGRWKTQKHAMKYHSYFLVLRKTNKKINYEEV